MYALSNIKHDGSMYFRGDHLPELTAEQARRLLALGVASEEQPTEVAQETGSTLVISDEERRANRKPKTKEKEEVKEEVKEEKKTVAKKTVAKKTEKHANPEEL